ncbi:MAG: hypothetical protein ACRC2S_16660 [Waterburya sp.]
MNANNWLIVFVFLAIATFLSAVYGWLVKKGNLPFRSEIGFNDAQVQFIKIWAKVALLIGVIIPVIMWLVFWNQPVIRQFFSCYLLAVVVQLASESSFKNIFCPSVVVIIGTIYTGFRIWQLWSGLHLINYQMPWLGLLWLIFLFWVANMIMLTTLAIPSILRKSNSYSLGSND